MKRRLGHLIGGALLMFRAVVPAQAAAPQWLSVWGTAQELTPPPAIAVPPPPPEVMAQFKTMPQRVVPIPSTIENQTVRMILRPALAAETVRIQLSNAIGKPALTIAAVHIAQRARGDAIDPSSDRTLTFGGKPVSYIPPAQ